MDPTSVVTIVSGGNRSRRQRVTSYGDKPRARDPGAAAGRSGETAADAEVLQMILRQDAFRLRRDEDWHAERLDEAAHGCRRRVRIEIEAEDHDRPPRAFDFSGHALERLARGSEQRRRRQA